MRVAGQKSLAEEIDHLELLWGGLSRLIRGEFCYTLFGLVMANFSRGRVGELNHQLDGRSAVDGKILKREQYSPGTVEWKALAEARRNEHCSV